MMKNCIAPFPYRYKFQIVILIWCINKFFVYNWIYFVNDQDIVGVNRIFFYIPIGGNDLCFCT